MKNKGKVTVNVTVKENGESSSKLPSDILGKIPRPGESIFIMEPYNVVDLDDVDGDEITEDDLKGKAIIGYSYAAVMVMASVLADDLQSVLINGDYNIPLYKDSLDSKKRLLVFANEEKAEDAFHTLMASSLREVERRIKLNENIKKNLEESKEKLFH
jgi:hypothetical protein